MNAQKTPKRSFAAGNDGETRNEQSVFCCFWPSAPGSYVPDAESVMMPNRTKNLQPVVTKRRLSTLVLLAWTFLNCAAAAELRINTVFSDHMVLQRNAPVTIWGAATPGDHITVSIAGHNSTVETDKDGAWRTVLPKMNAGGPFELTAASQDGGQQTISDIMIGDVFLCSGQSNMAWPVSRALNPDAELAASSIDEIRLLQIPQTSTSKLAQEFPASLQWQVAGPDSVRDFSALCYFFGKDIIEEAGVPVGLINASWGGSQIEAWISAEALSKSSEFHGPLALLDQYNEDPESAGQAFAQEWIRWWKAVSPEPVLPWEKNASPSGWRAAPSKRSWKEWGDKDLAGHDGMVWFRTEFTLTNTQAAQAAVLSLGGIDEVDMTWVNGKFAGGMFGWGVERNYNTPAGFFGAGKNELFINVYSSWGAAGMYGPDETMALKFADGSSVPLKNGWRYKKVSASLGQPPQAPWQSINGLTGLYNAMIAPLGTLNVTGVLWYQGESNTGNAASYEELLRLMISDWRDRFGEDLPFIIVQLPNFGALPLTPSDSGWARLRDEQRRAVQDDPHSGLVVTIDLGDPNELHPPNKKTVAARAAALARDLIYNKGDALETPTPERAYVSNGESVIEFDNLKDKPKIAGAENPIAFELCDANGTCRFVDAAVKGRHVRLTKPDGFTPSHVRYCWGDAPVCNWYDRHGVPITPFEITID